jgi:hypothetical protein
MTDKFLSRKFILTCVIQMLLFISLWFGHLPVEAFQTLTITIISGYLLLNTSQNVLTKDNTNDTTSL